MASNAPPFQSPTGPNLTNPPNADLTTPHNPSVPVVSQRETPGIDLLLSAAHHSESPPEHGVEDSPDDALAHQTPIYNSPLRSRVIAVTQDSPDRRMPRIELFQTKKGRQDPM